MTESQTTTPQPSRAGTGANAPGASQSIRPERQSGRGGSGSGSEEEDWRKAAREAGAPLAAFEPSSESAEEREEARSKTNDPDKAQEQMEQGMIYVKSGRDDDTVALYERAPEHPGGEVFVGPGDVVKVHQTASVTARLETGELVEVEEGDYKEYRKEQREMNKKRIEGMPMMAQFGTPFANPPNLEEDED